MTFGTSLRYNQITKDINHILALGSAASEKEHINIRTSFNHEIIKPFIKKSRVLPASRLGKKL